jgi:hypothetical protein
VIALLISQNNNMTANKFNTIIKRLMRQTSRWFTASMQDESPLVAVLHYNYGLGYWWTLKDIATPKQISDAIGGMDVTKYENMLTSGKDRVNMRVIKACPQYTGDVNKFVAKLA